MRSREDGRVVGRAKKSVKNYPQTFAEEEK